MSTNPAREEQLAMADLAYGRAHDIAYRTGLVLQVLGAAVLAVLYPLQDPFYTIGLMLFETGALLSGMFLLVGRSVVKKIIVGSIVTGLALQVAGFYAPEQYAGLMILAGLGIVCAGAAAMAGNEAYCSGCREGWLLMLLIPFLVLFNLLGKENPVLNASGFSIVFLLLLSLTGKKLKEKVRGQK